MTVGPESTTKRPQRHTLLQRFGELEHICVQYSPIHDAGGIAGGIGAAWEVRTNHHAYVFFRAFYERTLHCSRLRYACIPCGVHLPVARVQWLVCAVAMDVRWRI
jgi:hypothetical protein